jgi:vacuolar protein sorting-associated protein 35
MAKTIFLEAKEINPDAIKLGETKNYLLQILLEPITIYKTNILEIMNFPSGKNSPTRQGHAKSSTIGGNYTDLLFLQPYSNRRAVAHAAAKAIIHAGREHGFLISNLDGVNFIFGEICSIMVRDQVDGNLFGSYLGKTQALNDFRDERDGPLDWDDAVEEQTLLAKVIHTVKARDAGAYEEYNVAIS